MALSLKDPETDSLARQVAALTGETLTEAIRRSLADRLQAERIKRGHPAIDRAAIASLLAQYDALPTFDKRSAEDIIGYDEHGLPG